jgi:hypothetical protein
VEEELVDGEAEQQGVTEEEQQGWPRWSCSLQGMDKAELQELVDGGEAWDGGGGAAA